MRATTSTLTIPSASVPSSVSAASQATSSVPLIGGTTQRGQRSMTASSIQRIQASADNLPPSRDPNQADAPFTEKPHQGAFQNLGVSISHNLLLRDTEGMAFPSQGNLQGEQAYVFLAALNGHALQQKNAINSPERVRLNFLLGNITATDCTISFGKSSLPRNGCRFGNASFLFRKGGLCISS